MTSERAGDLTQGPLVRQTLGFGAPLALAMMGHGIFNLADMIIVARLGPGAVAAVTIGGIILPVAMVLFDGVINVTVALVSRFHGARQDRPAHDAAWESLFVTIVAGIAGGGLFFALSGPLVRFFALNDAATTAGGIAYLEVMSIGMIGMFLILQTTAVLRGVGNSIGPMVILIGANVLNVLLDIVLVFGQLGFPRLGVVGSAWATVIAQVLGGLVGLLMLWKGTHGLSLRRHRWRPPFRYLRTLILVGLPTSLQLAARVLAFFFLLRIGREAVTGGEAFLDGVGICIRLEMVAVFLGLGWGAAATPFVGQNLGALQPDRAAGGTWAFVGWAAVTMAAVGLLLWVFKWPVLHFVMPEIGAESVEHALAYLRITTPFYALLAVSLVVSRALNGAGSTKTSMIIDCAMYLAVLLPLAAAFSGTGLFKSSGADPRGAWWAAVFVHILTAVVYMAVFLGGRWKRKRLAGCFDTVSPSAALP